MTYPYLSQNCVATEIYASHNLSEWKYAVRKIQWHGHKTGCNNNVNSSSPWTNGRHFANDISNACSWKKKFHYWLRFCWSLFLRCNWQQHSIGLDNGLAPNRRQAINGTNADPIHWRIYAALGGDVLIKEDTYLQGKVSISHKVPALIVSLGSPRSSFTVVRQI